MSYFEEAKRDMEKLLKLVRESVAYCTSINLRPELASEQSHQKELAREVEIVELQRRLGVKG